jgi:hypothetical protein
MIDQCGMILDGNRPLRVGKSRGVGPKPYGNSYGKGVKNMAEKLNVGEVRCTGCKEIVNIKDERCPKCGVKTDPTGRFKAYMVTFLIMGLILVIGGPVFRALFSNSYTNSTLMSFLITPLIIVGVILIITAAAFAGLIVLNKKMRKKAFEEMIISK